MTTEARVERKGEGRFFVSGALTFSTVPDVWRSAVALLDEAPLWEVDLGGVTRSDSAGLAFLIEWTREARHRQKEVRLLNAPEQLLAMAKVSTLDRALPLSRAGGGGSAPS